MTWVPHALTLSRIPLGITLVALADHPAWFTVVLLTALVTDVLDGLVARGLGSATSSGAALDSIADAVLYLAVAVAVIRSADPSLLPVVIVAALGIAGIKVATVVVCRVRFGHGAGVHTWGNRLAGALVVAAAVMVVWSSHLSPMLMTMVIAVAVMASIEELWICATDARHRPDRRSIVHGRALA